MSQTLTRPVAATAANPQADRQIQPAEQPAPRVGRALHDATRPFAQESLPRSWWHVGSTFVLLLAACFAAAVVPGWPFRAIASVLAGLMMVRSFILFHDYMHGTILKRSLPARALLFFYSMFALTPPTSWKYSHNFHHAHVGKLSATGTGSFPLMTVDEWKKASLGKRLFYRFAHNPIIVVTAYLTTFLYSICILSLIRSPRKHWDSALAILLHAGLVTGLWLAGGFWMVFFAFWLPIVIASCLGGFLFFAQHNFEGMHILDEDKWDYHTASLESSSYMKLGPVMRYFTGNIGFHHVHHLNPQIPFYRLPEAMAAIPELQSPATITLRIQDIMTCFRLKLWDPARKCMVTYKQAMAN